MKASRISSTLFNVFLAFGLTACAVPVFADDMNTTSSNLPTPEQDAAMAPRAPAPQPLRRATYDSATDRVTYEGDQAAQDPAPPAKRAPAPPRPELRSGTTSAPDDTEMVPPRKDPPPPPPPPRVHDMNSDMRPGPDAHVQGPTSGLLVDAGLGAGFGLDARSVMWGIGGEYRFAIVDTPRRLVFKGLFDVNFAHGTDASQFLSIGVGANWNLGDLLGTDINRAFVAADVSVGDATNNDTNHAATSAVIGVGMGYTFLRTAQSDLDVLVHYAFLLNKLDNTLPSVLSFRVGASF